MKKRNVAQWNRIEGPEIDLNIYGQLIYDRGKNIQQRKDRLFKMLWLEKRTATCKRMKLEHSLTPYTKIKSKWIQFSSFTQSCLTLCDPMDCSMAGFPVHNQLPELVQTHVHQVGDAIRPSSLSSPSPPAFILSQHQSLFK